MDQIKTGNLIAQCRKEKGLTQAALAEQLGVSDRAVSKWETGRSLPDAGNMQELSGILGITIFGAGIFGVSMYHAIKIEREVGYYECLDCGHRYVSGFAAFINAPHIGKTRKMKCPQCGRRNWQKKVLTKN